MPGLPSLSPYRVGIVRLQDPANARVRVVFPDHDEVQSYWLPVVVPKTQNDKAYWIPDVGEQVVCLMDEYDEAGAVLGAIYSTADTPPVNSADKVHFQFEDGASFEYDRAAHALTISLPNAGATMQVTVNGATFAVDSSANITITSPGQIKLAGGGPAVARVGDTVHVTDDEGGTLTGSIVSGSAKVQSG